MPLTESDYSLVREVVLTNSAIVLERDKNYLVETRLLPVARSMGLESIEALVGKLRADPRNGVARAVVDAMTTNETSFFRDIHPFETMKKVLLPELLQKRAQERTLRIWCAACSTGQEPYSLAMLLKEHFPQLANWSVRILATDLCREVLERAKQGVYSQVEMNRGLPAAFLLKYFVQEGKTWRAREELRALMEFQEFNLARPFPPLPTFDFVFLRNVMIYFDIEVKKTILGQVRRVLSPEGYLFLGGVETTFNIDEKFESVSHGKTVCYRRKG